MRGEKTREKEGYKKNQSKIEIMVKLMKITRKKEMDLFQIKI